MKLLPVDHPNLKFFIVVSFNDNSLPLIVIFSLDFSIFSKYSSTVLSPVTKYSSSFNSIVSTPSISNNLL